MTSRVWGIMLIASACALAFWAVPDDASSVRWGGAGLALLVVMGCLYYWLSGAGTVFVISRAFIALLPVVFVAFFLTLFIAQGPDPTENRIMIAAVVVAGGWVVGFITQELRRLDEREERRRDLTKALIAEVQAIVELNSAYDWENAIADAEINFTRDQDYVPFLVFLHETEVLRRVVNEVELLRRDQIRDVYAFFHLMDKIRQIAVRLDTATYGKLATVRRKDIFIRLLKMHGNIVETGEKALLSLQRDAFNGLVKWDE
ncbi:MAG: hypothetical protein AAGA38_10000 [Pseudomonadota bacterium]